MTSTALGRLAEIAASAHCTALHETHSCSVDGHHDHASLDDDDEDELVAVPVVAEHLPPAAVPLGYRGFVRSPGLGPFVGFAQFAGSPGPQFRCTRSNLVRSLISGRCNGIARLRWRAGG
jgi:hypothetical protein